MGAPPSRAAPAARPITGTATARSARSPAVLPRWRPAHPRARSWPKAARYRSRPVMPIQFDRFFRAHRRHRPPRVSRASFCKRSPGRARFQPAPTSRRVDCPLPQRQPLRSAANRCTSLPSGAVRIIHVPSPILSSSPQAWFSILFAVAALLHAAVACMQRATSNLRSCSPTWMRCIRRQRSPSASTPTWCSRSRSMSMGTSRRSMS